MRFLFSVENNCVGVGWERHKIHTKDEECEREGFLMST